MHPASVRPCVVLVLAAFTISCGKSAPPPAAPRPSHPAVPWAPAQLSTEWEPSPSRAYSQPPAPAGASESPAPAGASESPAPAGAEAALPAAAAPAAPPAPQIQQERLTALLPAPPKGWSAEQASVETTFALAGAQTMVSRSYFQRFAPGAPSVQLAVRIDWAAAPSLGAEFDARCAEVGSCQDVTLSIGSGREFEAQSSKSTEMMILVQPGLAVQAAGQGVTLADLRAWVEKIPAADLKGLVTPTP